MPSRHTGRSPARALVFALSFTSVLGLAVAAAAPAATITYVPETAAAAAGPTQNLAIASDGRVWTQSPTGVVARRSAVDGTVGFAPITAAGTDPAGIGAGDGTSVWVGDGASRKITKIGAAGTLLVGPQGPYDATGLPLANLTTSADGRPWFSHGRGVQVTQYEGEGGGASAPVLPPDASVTGFAPTADLFSGRGAWFSASAPSAPGRGYVGHLDGAAASDTAVLQLPYPITSVQPIPGGDVWATSSVGSLYRIGLRGTQVVVRAGFPMVVPGLGASSRTAAAPNGDLWFTHGNGPLDEIARVSAGDGFINQVVSLGGAGGAKLTGIAVDADCHPWIGLDNTDSGSNVLVHVTDLGPCIAYPTPVPDPEYPSYPYPTSPTYPYPTSPNYPYPTDPQYPYPTTPPVLPTTPIVSCKCVPPPATTPAATTPPATTPPVVTPTPPVTPTVIVAKLKSISAASLTSKKGIKLPITFSGPGSAKVEVRVSARIAKALGFKVPKKAKTFVIFSGTVTATKAGTTSVTVKLPKKARRALAKKPQAFKLTVSVTAGTKTATGTVSVKKPAKKKSKG